MSEVVQDDRYIIFRLGSEVFGTPLLTAREVVELQPIKKIPNTTPDFLGVMNVRGEIIGVLDLRLRFGFPSKTDELSALIVFPTPVGTMAVVVDRLEAVVNIPMDSVEQNPNIQSKVPMRYLVGIAKHEGELVTLLDLFKTVQQEEVVQFQKALAA